jgi:hypothetical protein
MSSTQIQSTAKSVVTFLDALFLRSGEIVGNTQKMSKMLREARLVEARWPARAAALRSQARKLELA